MPDEALVELVKQWTKSFNKTTANQIKVKIAEYLSVPLEQAFSHPKTQAAYCEITKESLKFWGINQ